ncbi:MAG: PQQ-binding-like beta-propeller repeat protein [Acidobacteriaceae bacterium]|nr:PQQ-binding-like beta-propeller repeat protein [Acidobacteriaceae bacterium]
MQRTLKSLGLLLGFVLCLRVDAQNITVLTGQYTNSRIGANLNEPYLNSSLVNVSSFGKVATLNVDGPVYAQPLYMHGEVIGGVAHNVVYIATMNNSVYAFDADTFTQLWHVTSGLGSPMPAQATCPGSFYTGATLGILSTPVIDPTTNTLYVVSAEPDYPGSVNYYHHRLSALDVTTGNYKFRSPINISASAPGSAPDSVNGIIPMNQSNLIQRAALLLSGGTVMIGFGSCGPDPFPYHGWLLGYNALDTSSQLFAYTPTPQTEGGAIWQSGRGPALDTKGNVYVETGNGSVSETTDLGNSIVQFNSQGKVTASMTGPGRPLLDTEDLDLGATGPLITPDTNLLIAGGKQGNFYIVNPSALSQPSGLLQTLDVTGCTVNPPGSCGGIRSVAYWPSPSGGMLYVWADMDIVRAYKNSGSGFSLAATNSANAVYPGGILAVSAASSTAANAILWAVNDGVVWAFDASNPATMLWNSNQNSGRDGISYYHTAQQFTVAAGRLYVPDAGNDVAVYGPIVAAPAIHCPSSSAIRNRSYSGTVTASGGVAPYQGFSLSSGSLPPGLHQSGVTISGTPTQSGTFTFSERVIDGRNNSSGTGTASCSISVSRHG